MNNRKLRAENPQIINTGKRSVLIILTAVALFATTLFANAQTLNLKEQALEQFKQEHYDEAIVLLEKAVVESPNDAEIYYYLGFFNHYRAYDSRPLRGYDFNYSQKIFNYLDKAIALNPNYGDAKYFYGAECSGNAFEAMQNYDAAKLKYFYQLAGQKGAYPDWLIEFGKNILTSCDENAILFTGGNADFDICMYLQLCENFRTDITIIPIGNIDRPWYVQFLKNGLKNAVRSVNINITQQQITDLHPFKWKETDVFINISTQDKKNYKLPDDYRMKWTVYPDLQSERMHNMIEGENATKRQYLSPQRAILLQIVEDNLAERPVFFTLFAEPSFYGGLNDYFQNCGLVAKLTPLKTSDTDYQFDKSKIEKIFNTQNIANYHNIKHTDIPRILKSAVYGYGNAIVNLAEIYQKSGNTQGVKQLLKFYEDNFKINFDLEYEKFVVESLKKKLESGEN
jgi:hypothetical protein